MTVHGVYWLCSGVWTLASLWKTPELAEAEAERLRKAFIPVDGQKPEVEIRKVEVLGSTSRRFKSGMEGARV